MKSITLTLTDDVVAKINEALETRANKTFDEVALQALVMGIKQLNYRTERNRDQYAQFKEWKSLQK